MDQLDRVVNLFLNQDIWREPFKYADCKNFDNSDLDKLDEIAHEFLYNLRDLGVPDLPTKDDVLAEVERVIRSWE